MPDSGRVVVPEGVVVGYLPAGMILASPAQAIASLPVNALQVTIGAVIGVPLFILVRQAYPPISRQGN